MKQFVLVHMCAPYILNRLLCLTYVSLKRCRIKAPLLYMKH